MDKSGLPYVHHPLHLAEQMGFGDDVLNALRLLTHDDSVPYLDYVREIANNPVARKVKLADLAHNCDLSRLNHEPTEKDLERVRKYQKAREILGEPAL